MRGIVFLLLIAAGARADIQRPAVPESRPRVELYATSWCPACQRAREYLDARGIVYQEYDIDADRQALARYKGLGGRGVPLALIDGVAVHGFSVQIYEERLSR